MIGAIFLSYLISEKFDYDVIVHTYSIMFNVCYIEHDLALVLNQILNKISALFLYLQNKLVKYIKVF